MRINTVQTVVLYSYFNVYCLRLYITFANTCQPILVRCERKLAPNVLDNTIPNPLFLTEVNT